jgi:hypothetical protein
MKTVAFKTFLTLSLSIGAFFANGQTSPRIANGGSVENIYNQVEKLLRDSLNQDIKFDIALQGESRLWLDLKIQGKSTTGQIGVADFYGKVENDYGLNLSSIIQIVNSNINRIKSGDWTYRVGEDGTPKSFYMEAIEKDGKTYFLYAMN